MTASPGREVETNLLRGDALGRARTRADAQNAGRQNLGDRIEALGRHEVGVKRPGPTMSAWRRSTIHAITCGPPLFRKCRDLRAIIPFRQGSAMPRKRHLPPSPLAPRQPVKFDLSDPEQCRAAEEYLTDRFDRLTRDRSAYPNEFDRLIAPAEAWSRAVWADAGLKAGQVVSDEMYPRAVWYASQILSLAADIRRLREAEPDLVLGMALELGVLIGEARAHLMHGQDAARGLKAVLSARAGHEQVHGTHETKQARWLGHVSAYQKYRASGRSVSAAESLAAEERRVSPKTIFNSRKRAQVD
jgi:hypothetical protein